MSFYREENAAPRLVELAGPLLSSRVDEVTEMFRDLFRQGITRVVVDLSQVPLLDSMGLIVLVAGYRLFGSQPRNFRLAALQDQPRLVLDLTGFDHIIEVFETVAEAFEAEPVRNRPVYSLPAPYSLSLVQSPIVEITPLRV